jgi:hypothetical protein
MADKTEYNSSPELSQSPKELQFKGKDRNQKEQEFDVPHGESNQEHNQDTKPKRRTDTEGYKNFWQTRLGHLICSETGQVLCAYCGVQSHGRKDCYFKRDDEAIKVFRIHHPDRGNLLSRNQQLLRMQPHNGATYKKHKSLCRERSWIRQFVGEGSNNQWVGKDIDQNMDGWQCFSPCQEDGQQPILRREGQPVGSSPMKITPLTGYASCSRRPCFPQGVSSIKPLKLKAVPRPQTTRVATHSTCRTRPEDHNEISQPTLNDMPNEVLKIITSYLTFKERLRVGWTNTRLRALPMIPEFWRLVEIHDTTLSCTLITTVIEMGTKRLIIPRCSFQENRLEVYGLENFMIENAPELEHIDMAGYKGNDSLAATLIYMSKKLAVLDLSESRFALMTSIINKLPLSCNITTLDLSAIKDGAHQEWTDVLPYEKVKLLVNKCRKLTDLILFGTKLCRKSITHLCDNLTNTILRLNIAQEDIRDNDIEALSKQCPNLQYLNIADTMVSYNAIADITIGWKHTMIQLCLPKQMGITL